MKNNIIQQDKSVSELIKELALQRVAEFQQNRDAGDFRDQFHAALREIIVESVHWMNVHPENIR